MSDAKLTPWFAYGTRPVREGWYEVLTNQFEGPNYRYWDGHQWSFTYGAHYVEKYAKPMNFHGYSKSSWRGLARNPAA